LEWYFRCRWVPVESWVGCKRQKHQRKLKKWFLFVCLYCIVCFYGASTFNIIIDLNTNILNGHVCSLSFKKLKLEVFKIKKCFLFFTYIVLTNRRYYYTQQKSHLRLHLNNMALNVTMNRLFRQFKYREIVGVEIYKWRFSS